jgi:3-hydroxyacyl-[acyl-carrier-protein] dehydratase
MRWLLLDKIIECEPGVRAVGTKTFPRSDIFFMDHFPGMPIVPGVLQIEMIAQLAGKCISIAQPEKLPVLGNVKNARFYRSIQPGELCTVRIEVNKIASQFAMGEGVIEVNGEKCCSASILYGYVERTRLSSAEFDGVVAEWRSRQKRSVGANDEGSAVV